MAKVKTNAGLEAEAEKRPKPEPADGKKPSAKPASAKRSWMIGALAEAVVILVAFSGCSGKKTEEAAKQPVPTTTVEEKTETVAQPAPEQPPVEPMASTKIVSEEHSTTPLSPREEKEFDLAGKMAENASSSSAVFPETGLLFGDAATEAKKGEADVMRIHAQQDLENVRFQERRKTRAMELECRRVELERLEARKAEMAKELPIMQDAKKRPWQWRDIDPQDVGKFFEAWEELNKCIATFKVITAPEGEDTTAKPTNCDPMSKN